MVQLWRKKQEQGLDNSDDAPRARVSGKPPVLLALRSSTPFIALTVGLGVLVDLAG